MEIELVSLQKKTVWHVFEMIVDDDVTMGQVADAARLVQPFPKFSRYVHRNIPSDFCMRFVRSITRPQTRRETNFMDAPQFFPKVFGHSSLLIGDHTSSQRFRVSIGKESHA